MSTKKILPHTSFSFVRLRKSYLVLGACLVLSACLLLSACGKKNRYQDQFMDVFDTVSLVIGYEGNEGDFQKNFKAVHKCLQELHQLFDVYDDYPGVQNLKYVNENAGTAPVKVDPEIMALLKFGKEIYEKTDGEVNIAYGAVLRIWHDYREAGIDNPENASLPEETALLEASKHCNIEDLILDEENSTVYFQDPELRLDVGGIAKGWSVERAAELLEQAGAKHYLLNIGGNLRAIGKRGDGKRWVCPVENPFYVDGQDTEQFAVAGEIEDTSLVTSGDYERFYVVNGKRYAHIVDPRTRMPADRHRSVSILTKDSGLADGLSTALFILDVEEGKALLKKFQDGGTDVEAMWIEPDGTQDYTENFLTKISAEADS